MSVPTRRGLVGLSLATAALTLMAPLRGQTQEALPGRLIRHPAFGASAIPPRDILVWVPDAYDRNPDQRFPVIYMHDGQNLFLPATAYGGVTWGIAEVLSAEVAAGRLPPAIIVGVNNSAQRHREYMPNAVYQRLPRPLQVRMESLSGGPPVSDAYVTFLADELKPFIDQSYRTCTGAKDSALMGSSMGGLISLYAMMERPERFGAAACLSTHWPLLMPKGLADGLPPVADVRKAFASYFGTHRKTLAQQGLYLDRGDQTLDALYAPYLDAIAGDLRRHHRHLRLDVRAFPGAAHNEASWRERLPIPLQFLLGAHA